MENARFADTVSERIAHRTTPWNKGKLTGARCGRGDERRRRRASGGPSGRLSNPLPPRLDDFRLAFMFGQVARAGAVRWNAEQFARLRPLDDLWYAAQPPSFARSAGSVRAVRPSNLACWRFLRISRRSDSSR